MNKILGISAFYHDSAAAIVVDGKVIAAAQEERFSRKKHTEDFPEKAIKYCLKEAKLSLNEIDTVVFYDKPLLKFERLLETYYAFSPKGVLSFVKAMPVWLKEKLFLKKLIHDGLKEIGDYDRKKISLKFTEHHLSHGASSFYPSPFEKAAILTLDGVGEWATASIAYADKKEYRLLKEMHFPHSLGLLYSAFTYYLGFRVNSGEYKLMGLAPYGIPDSEQVHHFIRLIKNTLLDIKKDGSIWLNQEYFSYASGLRMTKNKKWSKLFGLKRRKETDEIEQSHCNLALAIQKVTEEVVIKMAEEAKRLTNAEYLCMAGGVALNCVANGKLLETNLFKKIYIQPASGDAGGALGAALATSYIYLNKAKLPGEDIMQTAYLGPSYSRKSIQSMISKYNAVAQEFTFNQIIEKTADSLKGDKVVGWFQGRMEFGPRALGNRSILANPRSEEMQKKLNLKIKKREGFRPFAPSVLEEDAPLYFQMKVNSPYMLLTHKITDSVQVALPENYYSMNLKDRLYQKRSNFQAITHIDLSARVQTVNEKDNEKFYLLLQEMKKQSGHGMLVNTSFNVRGEPIVNTPEDAYRCFMNTDMDVLIINNFMFLKEEQADRHNHKKWNQSFKAD